MRGSSLVDLNGTLTAGRASPCVIGYGRGVYVLVVDDNAELLDLVTTSLEREGHRVASVQSAAAAAARLESETFDVIVLDVGLPDRSGLDVCRRARDAGIATPILILTARAAVEQRVEGLDAGADDFLAKPFAVAELRARVRALGRRSGVPAARTWARGGVELDFPRRRALVDGREVPLTAKEWSILDVLASAHGRVVARTRILDEVWSDGDVSAASSLDVLMTRIRKKLGSDTVRTVRGEGYALS
jgi:DNA-binding response OmpR family regulator